MTVSQAEIVQVRTAGDVGAGMPDLARRRVEAALRHVGEPVLFARVMLKMAADPAVEAPSAAWATVSINGRLVRARADAAAMPEAISQLSARLRIRLARAWPDDREQARRTGLTRHRVRRQA